MKYTKLQQKQLDRPAKVLKTAHIPQENTKPKHLNDPLESNLAEVGNLEDFASKVLGEAEDSTEAKPVVEAEKPKPAEKPRKASPKKKAAAKKAKTTKRVKLQAPMKFGDVDE